MYSNENYLLELLVEAGAIDPGTLDGIKAELTPLDSAIEFLVKNNYLTAEYIAQVAAYNSSMEYVDLGTFEVDPNILATTNGELARRVGFLPIGDDGYSLQVAITDPFDMETLDSLPQFLGREISFFVTSEPGLKKALDKYYPEKKKVGKGDSEAPIIELIDDMFNEAHEMRASDIHIEPMEDRIRMRYRVDGRLVEVANHPKKLLGAIVARLKVMSSSMSIAEKPPGPRGAGGRGPDSRCRPGLPPRGPRAPPHLHSASRTPDQESKMVVAKRQGREKPMKIEQTKVKGLRT